jgi:hypothetical protein
MLINKPKKEQRYEKINKRMLRKYKKEVQNVRREEESRVVKERNRRKMKFTGIGEAEIKIYIYEQTKNRKDNMKDSGKRNGSRNKF